MASKTYRIDEATKMAAEEACRRASLLIDGPGKPHPEFVVVDRADLDKIVKDAEDRQSTEKLTRQIGMSDYSRKHHGG